jgi:hypothetical protein
MGRRRVPKWESVKIFSIARDRIGEGCGIVENGCSSVRGPFGTALFIGSELIEGFHEK